MSFLSHFSFFVGFGRSYENMKILCLFTFFKSLACLALQTETIIKKITQPRLPKTKNKVTKICNEPGGHKQPSCEVRPKLTCSFAVLPRRGSKKIKHCFPCWPADSKN